MGTPGFDRDGSQFQPSARRAIKFGGPSVCNEGEDITMVGCPPQATGNAKAVELLMQNGISA